MSIRGVGKKVSSIISYLFIKHDEKSWYDFFLPIILSSILVLIWYLKPFPLLGDDGLVSKVNSLLQMIIGFYIAALAAVATFPSPLMDSLMVGKPVKIFEHFNGVKQWVTLNRRQFLSRLFGYLAFSSLSLFMAGVFAELLIAGACVLPFVKALVLFIYSAVLFNILFITMLGLYYLAVGIHRHDHLGGKIIISNNQNKN